MSTKECSVGIPARYKLAILAFFGFVFNYMLRINISVAIVAMVNHTAVASGHAVSSQSFSECRPLGNATVSTSIDAKNEDKGEFVWNENTQALIIGSFFWGYVLTQLPGGRLAELFGAKYIFGFSILLAGLVNMLVPLLAATDAAGMIILRVLLGVVEGATYPSMHAMLAKWAPPEERSRLSSIVYSGAQAGTVIAFPLAGLLIDFWGWKAVFLTMGLGAVVWSIFWMLFAYDSPDAHPSLSAEERELLSRNSNSSTKRDINEAMPIRSILTSKPFWAIVVCSISSGWGLWTFLHQLPTYMKNILGFNMKKNSLLSAMPYTVMWIFGLVYGYFADRFRRSSCMTTGRIRKISAFFCLVVPGCCIFIVTFVGCDQVATVALLTVAIGVSGAKYSAYLTNHIDIAPNFAGTLLGIANCFATIPGWLAPIVAGALTNGQQTLERWNVVFYIATCTYFAGFLFYAIFASGEVQPWNEISKKTELATEERPEKLARSTDTIVSAITASKELGLDNTEKCA